MNELFSIGEGRTILGEHWRLARDGDDGARAIFHRHYSRRISSESKLFVGPGEKFVMVTEDGTALWVWRKFKSDNGQEGVNCAIFRNEGRTLSSRLILEAELIAWKKWPESRLYTYVDPKKVKSANPGACFIAAGWRRCGITKKRRYLILEKLHEDARKGRT